MSEQHIKEQEKTSRRRECIFNAVKDALDEHDYHKLTMEDVAARAGVGKSTIYRWWKHKSELIFELFQHETAVIFDLDFSDSLQHNLEKQLNMLAHALYHPIGRAVLVVMAEKREVSAQFFKAYLLVRREQVRKLIQIAILRQEIKADYPFELMLDSIYGSIHYQIIFFNHRPDETYIRELVTMAVQPILISSSHHLNSSDPS